MVRAKPCVICQKLTPRVLFGDFSLAIHICSWKCQLEYLETLRHRRNEQKTLLRGFDERIAKTNRYSRGGWAIAAVGIVFVIVGIFFTRFSTTQNVDLGVILFIIGILVVTCAALSTSYFDDRKRKLTEKRGKVA